ncbi:MAG: hypothetical protein LBI49_25220 [Nocardiopsaceae bacterium]|nr:hypothetical protein [Nocardiopsaceae bacterium]
MCDAPGSIRPAGDCRGPGGLPAYQSCSRVFSPLGDPCRFSLPVFRHCIGQDYHAETALGRGDHAQVRPPAGPNSVVPLPAMAGVDDEAQLVNQAEKTYLRISLIRFR